MSNNRFRFRVWSGDKFFSLMEAFNEELLGFFDDRIETYYTGVIIEQCIGLHDREGRLIFEGDIVFGNHVVVLHGDNWKHKDTSGRELVFGGWWLQDMCEITGNIHENPELLNE